MSCVYHQGEETIETCTLCWKPICAECILVAREFGFTTLCPKCVRTISGYWFELDDRVERD